MPTSSNQPMDARQAAWQAGKAGGMAVPEPVTEDQTLKRLLPVAISVVVHAVLVLLALFAVFVVVNSEEPEKVVVPAIRLSETPGAQMEAADLQQLEAVESQVTPTPQTDVQVNPDPVEFDEAALALTGVGGSTSNPFGDAPLSGELASGFMGTGGNAKSIVFVIDASGSLVPYFPEVIRELQRSIQALSPQQQFHVIFFSGLSTRPIYALNQRRSMLPATADQKNKVVSWVELDAHNVKIGRQGDPVAAIDAALDFEPELIYLLSDNITGRGKYEVDQEDLLREIRLTNRHQTIINTIQFIEKDTLAPDDQTRWTLFQIAQMSGGQFKFVDRQELDQGP